MRVRLTLAAVLALAILAAYAQVGGHRFTTFDDPPYVSRNPRVLAGLTWEGVKWAFTTYEGANWHPLTWLSHMLDMELFGPRPGAHLLVNVFWHALNAVLLFLALEAMTGSAWASAFAAALFALHPLHVESVAWISERKDVLSAFFWMLAMLAYVRYSRRPRPGRYLAVALLFALGLAAKPMPVTLPFVLLLLDWWPLGRLGEQGATRRSLRSLAAEKIPLLALSAASSAVTLIAQASWGAVKTLVEYPWWVRAVHIPVAYLRYLGKTFWPAHLAAFYPFPQTLTLLRSGLSLLLLGVVTLAALLLARRRPYVAFGWLWFLGTLVPVIGLVQVGTQAIADRYTYLPLVGIFVALAWTAAQAGAPSPRRAAAVAAVCIAVLGTLFVLTWRQAGYWRDSFSLYRRALEVTGENPVMRNNLGVTYADEGRNIEAVRELEEAIRLDPDYAEAYYNLGNSLAALGKPEAAVDMYRRSLELLPGYAPAQNNWGTVLAKQGKAAEAEAHFRESLRSWPGNAAAHLNLAELLAGTGRTREAVGHFRLALRLAPSANAHYRFGETLAGLGRIAEAEREFAAALALEPAHQGAGRSLEVARSIRLRLEADERRYRSELSRRPEDAGLHSRLGLALLRLGRPREALDEFREALRLDPDDPVARENIGSLERGGGDKADGGE